MYPQRELIRLTAYKVALQRDIAVHRAQYTRAAAHVAQPLELLDRILVIWRKLSPLALFAAVPLGFLVQRTVFPRMKILRSIMRWSPLVFTAVRGISSLVTTRLGSDRSSNGSSRF
jgi:hypothetical protein